MIRQQMTDGKGQAVVCHYPVQSKIKFARHIRDKTSFF